MQFGEIQMATNRMERASTLWVRKVRWDQQGGAGLGSVGGTRRVGDDTGTGALLLGVSTVSSFLGSDVKIAIKKICKPLTQLLHLWETFLKINIRKHLLDPCLMPLNRDDKTKHVASMQQTIMQPLKKKRWDLCVLTWKDELLLNMKSKMQTYFYGTILFSDSKKKKEILKIKYIFCLSQGSHIISII